MLITFAVGVTVIGKFSKKSTDRLATAATVAEEIISSIRTVQAYGSEKNLVKLYDDNLVEAQRMGYRIQFAAACMMSTIYFVIYASYALGFCNMEIV